MALIDNIISYYKCEEDAANTDVEDELSANPGTASVNTSNLSVVGKILDGFDFDGTEDIDIGDFKFAGDDNFSISCWFNADSLQDRLVLSQWASLSQTKIAIYPRTDGTVQFLLTNSVGNVILTTTATYSVGTWYHVVVTYNGTTKVATIYLNGNNEDDGTAAFGTASFWTDYPMLFAHLRPAHASYYDGKIDEVGIWGRLLDQDDVDELYNSGAGLTYPFTPVGTNMKVNISDVFKDIDEIKINIGDVWKAVTQIKINVGDVWKDVFG